MRGRPRGEYRSLADYKLLEYLVLVSTKYGVDSEEFFNCLVEAWENQRSTCKSLEVECRKITRENVVFLITNNSEVIAQFPIPKRILKDSTPLKGVKLTVSRKTALMKAKKRSWRIKDLKPGMKQVDLEAKILEIPKPKSVFTKFGDVAFVSTAKIQDETGVIHLPLWNKQISEFSLGDHIRVQNANVVKFRGEFQLRISRSGQLNVIGEK